ncbi:hypothetical protein PRS84_16865, partial [Escherichia coli]|nr:hypothetical protein [Escherichia coli]
MMGLWGVLLRITTLGGKFILMLLLTKFYGVSTVGIYGIIISIISFSIYIAGLEVYTLLVKYYNVSKRSDSFAFANQVTFSFSSSILIASLAGLYIHSYLAAASIIP